MNERNILKHHRDRTLCTENNSDSDNAAFNGWNPFNNI